MKPLKIGLLLNGNLSNKYIYELAEWMRSQAEIDVFRVVISESSSLSQRKKIKIGILRNFFESCSSILFKFIIFLEKILLRFSKVHSTHFDQFDLNQVIPQEFFIRSLQSNSNVLQISHAEIEFLKEMAFDLFIKCNVEISDSQILNVPRLGTIFFNEGLGESGEGSFTGFWESYYRISKTEFMIQSMMKESIPGKILFRGFFPTKFLFLLNQANLYKKSVPHIQNLVQKIASTGEFPRGEICGPYSGPPYQPPQMKHTLVYLGKLIYRLTAKLAYRLSNSSMKWEVSFILSDWKRALLWKSIRISAPKGHFWADPFIYVRNQKVYCFVEDYVYEKKRAHIAVLEITNNSAMEIGACIEESFHLSFPFLFHYENQLYMSPECNGSGQIRIYRCMGFPLKWELASIVMNGVSAVDTLFFEHAGLWWMITSIDRQQSRDYWTELSIYHAKSPLDTEWTSHPQNPVRVDPDGGRNAGLIQEDGRIFRLAQRQGYEQYGAGLLMYEITDISETVYSEKLFSEANPSFRKGLLGVHHLSTTGKITVFDHVSRSFFS
jgi:hypothetical protein